MNPIVAEMRRLGLTWRDFEQMHLDLRAALARNTNDLIHSFRSTR